MYTEHYGNQIIVRHDNGSVYWSVPVSSNSSHYINGNTLVVEDEDSGRTTIWDINKRQKIRST